MLGITSLPSQGAAAAVVVGDASAANVAGATVTDKESHDQYSRAADCDMDAASLSDVKLSLEWLRFAPPDVASAFLLSVEGQLFLRPNFHHAYTLHKSFIVAAL